MFVSAHIPGCTCLVRWFEQISWSRTSNPIIHKVVWALDYFSNFLLLWFTDGKRIWSGIAVDHFLVPMNWYGIIPLKTRIQFSSVPQLCPTLCYPMDCSMSGLPVHHQLPEFTQTHVHWVGDAIQPSHPLLSPSPLPFNVSQHQSLFQWVSSSHQVAKVLSFSFSISPSSQYSGLISSRMDWLDLLEVQGITWIFIVTNTVY